MMMMMMMIIIIIIIDTGYVLYVVNNFKHFI
jgi:hypothetical protein